MPVTPAADAKGVRLETRARSAGRAGVGRSGAPAAGAVEPAVERRQVHEPRRQGAGAARARQFARRGRRSATPASASRPSSCRTSSSGSARPTPASPASAAGSAWACRLRGSSPRCTAARSRLERRRRQGATFRVKLPLMIVHPMPRRDAARASARHGAAPRHGARRTCTACTCWRSTTSRMRWRWWPKCCEAAGARVTTAPSAEEALRPAGRGGAARARGAISACRSVDGFQLIERVRRHRRSACGELPAAALTAYARSEDRVKALRAGFQIHLAKPIDPAELVTTIAALAKRFVPRHTEEQIAQRVAGLRGTRRVGSRSPETRQHRHRDERDRETAHHHQRHCPLQIRGRRERRVALRPIRARTSAPCSQIGPTRRRCRPPAVAASLQPEFGPSSSVCCRRPTDQAFRPSRWATPRRRWR